MGCFVQRPPRCHLHDPAQVHDHDPVTDVAHHRQIVSDEDQRQTEFRLKIHEQVDDLRLDGDVQRAHRFIADDDPRLEHKGPRDADALALAPGELVGIAIQLAAAESHSPEDIGDPPPDRRSVEFRKVGPQGFAHDVAHSHSRIQRSQGVLEDDLGIPAHLPQCTLVQFAHALSQQAHVSGGGRHQPENGAGERRLAAARFTHDAKGLSRAQLQVHPVHGPQWPLFPQPTAGANREMDLESIDAQKRRVCARACRRGGGPGPGGAGRGSQPLHSLRIQPRHGLEQSPCVGVTGAVEDIPHVTLLLRFALVHHQDSLAQPGDDPQVVGDEHDGRAETAVQVPHQIEDLCLDGDIQRRRRFIGHQDLGVQEQARGDHDPLAHAAGEFMRVAVQPRPGVGNPDRFQHLQAAVPGRLAGGPVVLAHHLDHLLGDGQVGVQRRHRVLENHRDAPPANAPQRARREPEQVLAVKMRRTTGAAVVGQQPHQT